MHSTKACLITLCLSFGFPLFAATSPADLPSTVWVIENSQHLLKINPRSPGTIQTTLPVQGLASGEKIVGIDFRVARGDLYALSSQGRIFIINLSSGVATLVPGSKPTEPINGGHWGFDFNPAADKMRVVGKQNLNLRLHPDTGAIIDFDSKTSGTQTDPKLTYDRGDINAAYTPDIVAAAYTYNPNNEKLTTNYAIDKQRGTLVMQGTIEGATPAVSPNLGVLYTIGGLGIEPIQDASLDISDINNIALGTITTSASLPAKLVVIDLTTGRAELLGHFPRGKTITGLAIEP
ncbi:DUF4394 domain-containing protein [Vibrio navarrensis]|uniref:DUF4394 domain-containing protein n=1 Tax=Vibrio navarrensis TaxID=29495 RepID=A0AAI9CTC0_9VIBR|nr:DUF4394 domain-containing protein [Vibrio navarrensis]ELN6932275.1 DUF4394 domain-containing protein [Vibrio navarrensis]